MQLRIPRNRTYLMCRPQYYAVEYEINPWMDMSTPVDTELAVKQWDRLYELLVGYGHQVALLDPIAGLPDLVFAANGGFSVDGTVYGAKFKYPQRAAEAAVHEAYYRAAGWRYVAPTQVNEGEGDFAYVADRGLVLAGYGFRTETAAHKEAQEVLGRPVISLQLVDPRVYHLDVALAAIDDGNVAYYPKAFSTAAQDVLRRLFPEAVLADEDDCLTFGLNLVSDGLRVFLPAEASGMAAKLEAAGYEAVPVDLSELKKGGGSVKCCVAELRHLLQRAECELIPAEDE